MVPQARPHLIVLFDDLRGTLPTGFFTFYSCPFFEDVLSRVLLILDCHPHYPFFLPFEIVSPNHQHK